MGPLEIGIGVVGLMIVGLASLLVLVAVVAAMIVWARGRRAKAQGEMHALLGGEQPVLAAPARSLGIESFGVMQARGNGELTLTPTRFVFVQWVPLRKLVVPRDKIVGVETTNTHLGKWQPSALLEVRFINEAGAPDSIAFNVADLGAWLGALRSPTPPI